MRPKARIASMGVSWQFAADLSIIAWLEHGGYDYELVTDEDLHREGVGALSPHRVVLTGTHPEYTSEAMLDAAEDYVASGGRLIYMGGNGFYWNAGYRAAEPWCMEVRKLNSGMRAWQARPGEYYMATTGQKSGLWKDLGRPPQKLTGVGFISEGFDSARPFRRMPDGWHRRAAWMFEGIQGEILGDFGLAHGAAGGLELDRYDLKLGTPPHALIVASSGGHSDTYVTVTEEILYPYPGLSGSHDYRVRADMVYFTAPNGGSGVLHRVDRLQPVAPLCQLPEQRLDAAGQHRDRVREARQAAGMGLDRRGEAMAVRVALVLHRGRAGGALRLQRPPRHGAILAAFGNPCLQLREMPINDAVAGARCGAPSSTATEGVEGSPPGQQQ